MLEFSGWFHSSPSPAVPATCDDGGFWQQPGNVLTTDDFQLTLGDGSPGTFERSRATLRPGPPPLVAVCTGILTNAPALRSTLRARGHELSPDGWSDLVIAAFQEWGEDFAEHLEGSYALAVRDGDGDIHLVRDRIGVKPLYYAEYDSGVVFSTRPARILAHPRIEPWMSEHGLVLALMPRLVMPGETPVANLREVRPGHRVRIRGKQVTEACYWRLESRPHIDTHDQTVATVRRLLEDAVSAQLALDPQPGILMSGGLDSTAVAALTSRLREDHGDRLRTYAIEFEGDDTDFRPSALRPEPDAPYARLVAQELGTDHQTIFLTTAELIDALDEARDARGMPGWGQFDTSWLVMAKTIRSRSETVLTGSFADEIFGGYPWFHDPTVLAADSFPWQGNAPRVWASLSPEFIARVDPASMERERYQALLRRVPRLAGDSPQEARMREALFLSLQGPTAVNQERGERMSAAAGLNSPSPYNDHKLLQYVWNVPWSMKNQEPGWKYLLKEAVKDVVPQVVLDRPKSGYPGTHDPRYAAATMEGLREITNDPSAPLYSFLDQRQLQEVAAAADHTMTFTNAAHMLIPMLETNTWMKRFGVKVR